MALPVGLVAAAAACGGAPTPPPPRPVAIAVPEAPPQLPAWTYWEEVEVPVVSGVRPGTLPVDLDTLVRTPGAGALWNAAPAAMHDAIRARGFAARRPAHPATRVGDFYAALRDDGVPALVTFDALYFLAHLALDRAHAEVDARVVGPSLAAMLRRLDTRLATDARASTPDLDAAYLVARGVVAVGLALAQPSYAPPPALSALVLGEKARVLTHSARGVSPWLGVPVDYTAMAPRGRADADDAHANAFRAMAWLQGVTLALEGTGEDALRTSVSVATARTHARASLLLARLVDHDVDAEAWAAWARIARAGDVAIGDFDDPSPRDLEAAASKVSLDPKNLAWLPDVTAVDRVRRAAARARAAHIDPSFPAFHLVGPRTTQDGEALQALVWPSIGALAHDPAPPSARDGKRALPTALDVAAWLGSTPARLALHDAGDDGYARYDDALDRLMKARPALGATDRHSTPYHSSLDTLETWLRPSVGDVVFPTAATAEWRARKASVAMTAWTELRHDALSMARVDVPGVRLAPPPQAPVAAPVFVEPHPEAIADLLALVRQTVGVLAADGAVAPGGTSQVVLTEVEEILWQALGAAVHEASDQPIPKGLASELAALPARMRALEAALGTAGGADVPLAVDVHTDPTSGRVLEEAVGRVDELWVALRDPGTHQTWLTVGAALPHDELVQPMAQRLTDAAWAASLDASDPPVGTLERAYYVPPP